MTEIETYYFQALEFAKNKNDQFKHEELRENLKHIPEAEFKNLWTGLYLMNFIEGGSTWFKISPKGELELSRLQGQKKAEENIIVLSNAQAKDRKSINWNNIATIALTALLAYFAFRQNELSEQQFQEQKRQYIETKRIDSMKAVFHTDTQNMYIVNPCFLNQKKTLPSDHLDTSTRHASKTD